MNSKKICPYCKTAVFVTGYETKIWTELCKEYYHNRCLERALQDAAKLKAVEEAIHGSPGVFLCISDVWHCERCGDRSGGYGVSKCYHCGAMAHYGSDNGYYTRSDVVASGD